MSLDLVGSLPLPTGPVMEGPLSIAGVLFRSQLCCFSAPLWASTFPFMKYRGQGSKPAPKAKKQILSSFSCRSAMTLFPMRSFLL